MIPGLFLCLLQAAFANDLAEAAFEHGKAAFEQHAFDPALDAFEQAESLDPADARFPLWAGRAAGRAAELSGPFDALALARRAHDHFERAYALEPRNPDIVSDLAEFHEKAPHLVGGDEARARELREQLKSLPATAVGIPEQAGTH